MTNSMKNNFQSLLLQLLFDFTNVFSNKKHILSYYPSSPSIRHAIPINTSQLYRTRNFHMSFTRLFITHLSLFLFFCFVVFLPQQYIIFDALLRLHFFYILSLITSLLTARDDRPTDEMDIDGKSYTFTIICQ